MSVVDDLRAECESLDATLATLPAEAWTQRTVFFDWTVADEVMHLHLIDFFSEASLQDPAAFPGLVKEVRAGQARGIELSHVMRTRFGHLDPPALRAAWRKTWEGLCAAFEAADSATRMPWFGPDMSVRSAAAARQMEVWAHGQDIYDVLRLRRANKDRIRNICDLGVRTFGWSFRNRKEEPPVPAPRVALTGPSGAVWSWNDANPGRVEGPAEDFALVVTQRRNIADTRLAVEGAAAERWMAIAQCFAGPAETGPAPGLRAVTYKD